MYLPRIHTQGVSACHVLLLFHFAKSSSLLLQIFLSAPEPVSAHNILLNVLSTHGLLIPKHVRIPLPPSSVQALLVQFCRVLHCDQSLDVPPERPGRQSGPQKPTVVDVVHLLTALS